MLIRVFALATLAVVVVYHVLRVVASACNGAACDVYIPLSLLLPALAWIGAALTGVVATVSARREPRWPAVLIVCTAVSVAGPIAGLVILRDNPDVFVVSSTVFLLAAPAAALIYSFRRGSMTRR